MPSEPIPDPVAEPLELIVGVNSYVSLEYADAVIRYSYLDAQDWDILTEDQKAQVLVMAADRIDSLLFKGQLVDEAQPMAWPREGALRGIERVDIYEEAEEGEPPIIDPEIIDYTYTIPDAVLKAQCDEALAVLRAAEENVKREDIQRAGVRMFWLSQIREEYAYTSPFRIDGLFSKAAMRRLRPWLVTVARITA